MRYTIKNNVELKNNFTKIPNSVFNLSAAEFKLYAWILKHEDGYSFGKMFMIKGSGLRNVTVEKILPKLVKKGLIEIVNNDTITVTNDCQK